MTVRRRWLIVVAGFCLVLVALWAGNTSYFIRKQGKCHFLLAHRGIGQTFSLVGVTARTCTASRINPPQNSLIDNTVPAIRRAFEDGANGVVIDVQPTIDGHWVVFHDRTLNCQTNGDGLTANHSLAYLQGLDVGYGYTADGGQSYPLRGKGVGLMPSLDEVLRIFPGRSFYIDLKSNIPKVGVAFAQKLSGLPEEQQRLLMIGGGNRMIAAIRRKLPSVRASSPQQEERCLISYMVVGWSGYLPKACRNTGLLVPANLGPLLWGWPTRFVSRMSSAHTTIFLANDVSLTHHAITHFRGIDSVADLRKIPRGYGGGIWTDDIGQIGSALRCAKGRIGVPAR